MSTAHQQKMGYKERIQKARSMGEAKAILEEAKANLPAKAFARVKRTFDTLSFHQED